MALKNVMFFFLLVNLVSFQNEAICKNSNIHHAATIYSKAENNTRLEKKLKKLKRKITKRQDKKTILTFGIILLVLGIILLLFGAVAASACVSVALIGEPDNCGGDAMSVGLVMILTGLVMTIIGINKKPKMDEFRY